jgi:hypothetical protein
MTGIVQFHTRHGVISVEIDPSQMEATRGQLSDQLVAKGGPVSTAARGGLDIVVKAPQSFDEAMGTLRAYAACLEDVIMGLNLTPSEVSVEIGLKMSGSAGFIIARAGAETEMKVALTWEPKPKSQT